MLQVGVDSVNELGDTVDGQPFELPFVEFTEEAFHDVGPGGSSGDEVEVDRRFLANQFRTFSCLCVA